MTQIVSRKVPMDSPAESGSATHVSVSTAAAASAVRIAARRGDPTRGVTGSKTRSSDWSPLDRKKSSTVRFERSNRAPTTAISRPVTSSASSA